MRVTGSSFQDFLLCRKNLTNEVGKMADFAFAEAKGVEWGCFPAWKQWGVVHGFLCRTGGCSSLFSGGLNLSYNVGDDREKVLANRQKMAAALDFPLERAVACQQVHSTHVAVVTERDAGKGTLTLADAIPETDGMVTDCHRLPLLISYADCVPILLADTRTGAVGAVHGGWRGSVGKIVPHALNVMKEAFGTEPGDVVAGIGPSIGPCCYEVGQEVADRAAEYPSCLTPHRPGHYMLDLWQLNTLELLEAGVPREQIYRADCCTSCHKDRFFSYRAEKGKTGRLYAVIYRK